jgi:hypothetical protein
MTSSAPLDRVDLAKVIDQGSEERSRRRYPINLSEKPLQKPLACPGVFDLERVRNLRCRDHG